MTLLRRPVPPIACLSPAPHGAGLRSVVEADKGQVQRSALRGRHEAGGGAAAPERGADGGQDVHASWGFLVSHRGSATWAQYRKTPSSDLQQGPLSENVEP